MASVYDIKPRFQARLRPLAGRLAGRGVTANQVTVAAAAGSCAVGGLLLLAPLAVWLFLLVPVWLLVRMALNAIDGMLAREHGMTTRLGAVLNEVGDVVSDVGLYLPFAVFDARTRWLILLFLFGAVLTELCGVLMQALGASRRYDGPMGKSDRAVLVSIAALVPVFAPAWLSAWGPLFALGAGLVAWTCINRVRRGLGEIEGGGER